MMVKKHIWSLILVLLVAAALRLAAMGQVPPGLYHDEAYNGLDALQVLDGDLSLYFSANNGREPMLIYLIAGSVGLLGRSPIAVRLAAFAPGLLTVAATYALARALFSRRVGLLSAATLSVTLWHVHLSRVGFRAVLLPLFLALALWQAALGWRSGHRRHWIAAGILYGLTFYTYIAARFTPLALILFGFYVLRFTFHPIPNPAPLRFRDYSPQYQKRNITYAILALLATLAPLALFTLAHPDLILTRTGQVSIWNPEIHGGDFWGTLVKHTTQTLGMFFVRGDRIWRHNLPERPVFDPLLGIFFLIGLIRAVRGFRRDPALAFILIWTGTMLLPTLLAEDAPHFLRGVGVLPLAVLFPALGIDWLLRNAYFVFRTRTRDTHYALRITHYAIHLIPLVIFTISLISTSTSYFHNYAQADLAAYWFEDGVEDLAGRINAFLDTGWDGERTRHGTPGDRKVYVERKLWENENWTAVPFLVEPSAAIHLLPEGGPWPAVGDGPAAIFVWPYGDWMRSLGSMLDPSTSSGWSTSVEIRVGEGARSQGDRDPQPYTTYRVFYVTPVASIPPALARFEGSVDLVGAVVGPIDQVVYVQLRWHATASPPDDYTVFVHYMRGGERIAQDDAPPAGGHYPTSRWRAGDVIHDEHAISLPTPPDPSRDQILVGLYNPTNTQRLERLDEPGDFVALSIDVTGEER